MFDHTSGEGMVVNWRGPLLMAAIFAATFAILLLMAHQNQSNTSEMGSSLRDDPYGTSLLFDSYAGAGYQVKRSQDEDSLSDQDALKTTAFFIGGNSFGDVKIENGVVHIGEKFRARLERFLTGGGRVVLVSPQKLKSESQGWEVGIKWYQTPHESEPIWISGDPSVVPEGIEQMYLGGDAPWLQTDAGWTPLYSAIAGTDLHVYMAMRRVGNGELIAASQESFLLNETIKMHQNPVLLDFLVGGRPIVWVDETLHGLHQDQGVLWLVHRYKLQVALLLFWATLLALLWSMSGDLVRRPIRNSEAEIVRHSEAAGVAARRLLQRSIGSHQVLTECWEEFRRRSPQDAQAISADPKTGSRLREALSQAPLAGYKQLNQLIAERRASAKGLLRVVRPDSSTSLPKKHPEEVRTT
jgi:hypothetical protein